jgi:hypothetical protein
MKYKCRNKKQWTDSVTQSDQNAKKKLSEYHKTTFNLFLDLKEIMKLLKFFNLVCELRTKKLLD